MIIDVDPQKCTGCLRCQLACSFQYTREFNLGKANIMINDEDSGVNSITFKEDCTRCGICAQYCVYGALKTRKES